MFRINGFYILLFLFLEIASIVWVSSELGVALTLLLMIASFFLGSFMLRNLGLSALPLAVQSLNNKKSGISLYQMLWPVRYVFSAILLISPGFFSSICALILLLPIKGPAMPKQKHDADDGIIEGEFTEYKEEKNQKNLPH